MTQVKNVKSQDQFGNMAKGILPVAGQVIGNMYGGPAGGMAGGMIGNVIGGGIGSKDVAPVEGASGGSALDRRMQQIESDPLNQLKQGKAALSSMDPDTQSKLSPVLDEAIKKAALQKQGGAV